MEHRTFTVKPDGQGWSVYESGFDEPLSAFERKADAVAYAHGLAQSKPSAEVQVCRRDGSVETTQSFSLQAD